MSASLRTYTSRSVTRSQESVLSSPPPTQKDFILSHFQVLNTDLSQLERNLRRTLESVLKIATSCLEYDLNDNEIQKCKSFVELGEQALTYLRAHEPTLSAIKQKMINTPYESTEELKNDYISNLNLFRASSESNARGSAQFTSRLERILQTTSSQLLPSQREGEEEIYVLRDTNPADLQCPITGTYIKELLLSKECHHAYEKEAVLMYLRSHSQHQRIECLYSGCSKSITLENLVEAPDLQRRMLRNRSERHNEDQYLSIS